MLSTFQIYKDRAGQYRWRLKARNGEIVAVSESYITLAGAKRSAELVKALASVATITYL
jgi:hypothetical protein